MRIEIYKNEQVPFLLESKVLAHFVKPDCYKNQ